MIYYDIEDMIDDVLTAIADGTTGINARIDAINTQKAVVDAARGRVVMTVPKFTYDLATVSTEGFKEGFNLFFFMVDEFTNADPYLLVSIDTWTTDELGANIVSVNFHIAVEDTSDGTDPKRKLLRLIRALREVLDVYVKEDAEIKASSITQIEPDIAQVFFDETSKSFYSAGVRVNYTFA